LKLENKKQRLSPELGASSNALTTHAERGQGRDMECRIEYTEKITVLTDSFHCWKAESTGEPSTRVYTGLPDIDYPFHDKTIVVTNCGRIRLGHKKINFSTVFAGQAVGIKEVHDNIWLVSFRDYDLGYFGLETCVLEPLENPFGPKVLPM
jgi:hypothetical protein